MVVCVKCILHKGGKVKCEWLMDCQVGVKYTHTHTQMHIIICTFIQTYTLTHIVWGCLKPNWQGLFVTVHCISVSCCHTHTHTLWRWRWVMAVTACCLPVVPPGIVSPLLLSFSVSLLQQTCLWQLWERQRKSVCYYLCFDACMCGLTCLSIYLISDTHQILIYKSLLV